jgi:hypothetical protein
MFFSSKASSANKGEKLALLVAVEKDPDIAAVLLTGDPSLTLALLIVPSGCAVCASGIVLTVVPVFAAATAAAADGVEDAPWSLLPPPVAFLSAPRI